MRESPYLLSRGPTTPPVEILENLSFEYRNILLPRSDQSLYRIRDPHMERLSWNARTAAAEFAFLIFVERVRKMAPAAILITLKNFSWLH
jgi:hypothetical protein